MKRTLTALILLSFFSHSFSQSADTLSLPEIVVEDSVAETLQSGNQIHLRPNEQSVSSDRDMSNYLTRMTTMRFNDYGPGLSSTPTFRSGDANHTQVLWNGFTLNSPMLGSVDFSNLPVSQFSSATINTGNSSNLYTSGALGGSVHLTQKPIQGRSGLNLNAHYGSFGNFGGDLSYQAEIEGEKAKTLILFTSDLLRLENRFSYINDVKPESPVEVLSGSDFSRVNLSANVRTEYESSSLDVIYWFSGSERHIPQPILFDNTSSQVQKDEAHRAMIGYEKRFKNSAQLTAQLFYENNLNYFADTVWDFENNNRYDVVQTQVAYVQRIIPRLKFNVRLNPSWIQASTESYAETHDALSLNGTALLEGFWLKDNRLVSEIGVRLHNFASSTAVTPYGGLSYYLIPKQLALFGSYSENVRFPTFNEQFWNPGGNLNLRPESSEMIETGIRYRRKKSLAQATFFSGAYKDRIRWLPIGDTWVYGPINIDQSTSMGVEVQYEHEQKLNWGEVFWNLNGGWTQATWVTDSTEYQLSYIPALSGGLVLGTRVRDFEFTYSHNYTSERFTTSDESQSLPAYQIGSVRASYKVFGKENSHSLNLSVEVNNVWGESYQIMPWRPMPGRELIFTLRYSI